MKKVFSGFLKLLIGLPVVIFCVIITIRGIINNPTHFNSNNSATIQGRCVDFYEEKVSTRTRGIRTTNYYSYIILDNGSKFVIWDRPKIMRKFENDYSNQIVTVTYQLVGGNRDTRIIIALSDDKKTYISLEDSRSSNSKQKNGWIFGGSFIILFSLVITLSLSLEDIIVGAKTIIQKKESERRKYLKKQKRREALARKSFRRTQGKRLKTAVFSVAFNCPLLSGGDKFEKIYCHIYYNDFFMFAGLFPRSVN